MVSRMSSAKVHDIAAVAVEVGDGGGAGGGVLHWWTSGGGHLGLLELWATEYFDLKKKKRRFQFWKNDAYPWRMIKLPGLKSSGLDISVVVTL